MVNQNPQDEVRLIAVMGETGAGKSSFINSVLGRNAALVSDSAFSCTREVEGFLYERQNGPRVLMVDSPGFNDYGSTNSKTDAEILQMIAAFLKTQYDEKRKFSGVVFLHNINSGPAGKATRKNMNMFKRLCGDDQMSNVVVVTTRWDECNSSDGGIDRAALAETNLMDSKGLLKDLSDAKVPFYRTGHFTQDNPQPTDPIYRSPQEIVENLLGLEPVYLKIQEEMAEGKSIQQTDAGLVLQQEFEALKRDLNDRMDNIHKAMEALESAREDGKSDWEQKNVALQQRVKDWEELHGNFNAQWENWEANQKTMIAAELESLKVKQQQELNDVRAEFREAHSKISGQGMSLINFNNELKDALAITRKERADLSVECQALRLRERQLHDDLNEARTTLTRKTLDLHADRVKLLEELNVVKSTLAERTAEVEIMKKELSTVDVQTVRAQLEQVSKDRDHVKAYQLQSDFELERIKIALAESKDELEKWKAEAMEQAEEIALLREQEQLCKAESESFVERISALENDLRVAKTKSGRPISSGYTPGLDFIQPRGRNLHASFASPEILRMVRNPISPISPSGSSTTRSAGS